MLAVALAAMSNAAPAETPAGEQGSAATRLQSAKIDEETLRSNMESVGKLIDTSSAARQIEASKTPEALDKRDRARALYKSAQAALAAGELAKASQLLADTRAMFFDAVRLAAPGEVTAKKLESDYKARLDSVNALLAAYKRIATEKGVVATGLGETVAPVEKGIAEAAKLAQAEKYKEARSELDRVYLVIKAGISGLRSGDTLVRSLNFATKEEEYNYEIDRNNTHQLLIEAFLSDKRADSTMQRFIAKAKELRAQAEGAGKGKDYATGVKLLEESTAELVRAIRGAGIYIPG
jgi:hypothetical protein